MPRLGTTLSHTTQHPQHLTAHKIIYDVAYLYYWIQQTHLECYFAEPQCLSYQGHKKTAHPGTTQVPMSMPPNQCHSPNKAFYFKRLVFHEAIVGQCQSVERTKPFSGLLYTWTLLMLKTVFHSDLQPVKRSNSPFHSLL